MQPPQIWTSNSTSTVWVIVEYYFCMWVSSILLICPGHPSIVIQFVLASSPLYGRLTRYCFLFKCLGQEFVVLSLWGALSDSRPGLYFVSNSLVICLRVHLLFTFFSLSILPYTYICIYIYIHYTIHIIYTRPLLVLARYSRFQSQYRVTYAYCCSILFPILRTSC
jgi:hypothetical protein